MFTIGELKKYVEENNLSDNMPIVIDNSHINGMGLCIQNPAIKETPHLSLTSERQWKETERIKENTFNIFAMEGILFEPPKLCKGIYVACDAPVVDGRDYCAECWNAGEDLAREENAKL